MEKIIGLQINKLAHKFRKKVREESEKNGIPSSYFHVLNCIKCLNEDNIVVTQKVISEYIKYKPSTVSVTLSNMENDGLIERKKDENDNRVTIISLTKSGKEMCKKIKNIFDNIESKLTNCLDSNELDSLFLIIDKLLVSLEGR